LADKLVAGWKKQFPKTNIQAEEFQFIEKGFHKKFCYITTAVCETFGKSDDCYELTTLRDYRDNYLASLPEGEELIRMYYDVAPTIVKHINQKSDSGEIYRSIWDTYLAPCISMIEHHQLEDCRSHYEDMVHTLQKEYFYQ
ncbi:MAG: CFI-box-CTERM domain-containing protein, partial [Candidatus Choladocola sp.]|nr:CFI-box-CTERM domain-containing protein [Candidatus Choladocola sp.]